MRSLPAVLTAVFCLLCSDAALAIVGSTCPSLANQRNTQFPAVAPMGQATYLCNNAVDATDQPRLGDLSPEGQELNTQICDSNCNYHPLFPNDPDSPLIPTSCGRGRNIDTPFAVNGSGVAQANNQGPPNPYMGTGGNCLPLMVPQAPIIIQPSPGPAVKENKPGASPAPGVRRPQATPSPSPAPSPSASPK